MEPENFPNKNSNIEDSLNMEEKELEHCKSKYLFDEEMKSKQQKEIKENIKNYEVRENLLIKHYESIISELKDDNLKLKSYYDCQLTNILLEKFSIENKYLTLEKEITQKNNFIIKLENEMKNLKIKITNNIFEKRGLISEILNSRKTCAKLNADLDLRNKEMEKCKLLVNVVKRQFNQLLSKRVKSEYNTNYDKRNLTDLEKIQRYNSCGNWKTCENSYNTFDTSITENKADSLSEERNSRFKENESLIEHLQIKLEVKQREIQEKQKRYERNYRTLLQQIKEHMAVRKSTEKHNIYLSKMCDNLSEQCDSLKSQLDNDCSKITDLQQIVNNLQAKLLALNACSSNNKQSQNIEEKDVTPNRKTVEVRSQSDADLLREINNLRKKLHEKSEEIISMREENDQMKTMWIKKERQMQDLVANVRKQLFEHNNENYFLKRMCNDMKCIIKSQISQEMITKKNFERVEKEKSSQHLTLPLIPELNKYSDAFVSDLIETNANQEDEFLQDVSVMFSKFRNEILFVQKQAKNKCSS